MNMPTDATPVAQAVQLEILREMSGERRMLLAFEMSDFARELAKEGIRREHPEWTKPHVARELLRLAFFPAPLPSWIPAVEESEAPREIPRPAGESAGTSG